MLFYLTCQLAQCDVFLFKNILREKIINFDQFRPKNEDAGDESCCLFVCVRMVRVK